MIIQRESQQVSVNGYLLMFILKSFLILAVISIDCSQYSADCCIVRPAPLDVDLALIVLIDW